MNKGLLGKIKIVLFILVVVITLAYAYYQSKGYLNGPILEINQPTDGLVTHDRVLKITAFAQNVAYISLNDRQIYADEKGNVQEEVLLFPGYNIITLSAEDKFQRKAEKTLEVVLLD